MSKCYMCDVRGVTREHVPPFSFFPDGFRTNLWTVRSCEAHNLSNSKDVEYARNVIICFRNASGAAQQLAESAAFRSFERSAALFTQTFQHARLLVLDGEPTAVFPFDPPRFKRVMEAIAYAIYFRENGRRFEGNWEVFSPNLASENDLQGVSDKWSKFRALISAIPFQPKATPKPTVFKYGIHTFDDSGHFAYAFLFYGGFSVYVWTAP